MVTVTDISRTQVMDALEGVKDPEIPAVSILDLGIVDGVQIDGTNVTVICLPTFVGCPALDVIREDIESALEEIGAAATVNFVFKPAWTSDRISDQGKAKLLEYGLAPPAPQSGNSVNLTLMAPGKCPYCGSTNTILESPFGPTACRATCYCRGCRNPFEQFKQV